MRISDWSSDVCSSDLPIPLSIVSAGDEPTDLDMPEPFAAQAECGGVIAAIFDLFTDTRLEAFAPDIAWGFVNSFHFTAGKLARREDSIAQELGDLARMPDLSEVYARSEERRVGNEWVSTCRSRRGPYHI